MKCDIRQYSDEMHCVTCRLRWDVNDPHPPVCDGKVLPPSGSHSVRLSRQCGKVYATADMFDELIEQLRNKSTGSVTTDLEPPYSEDKVNVHMIRKAKESMDKARIVNFTLSCSKVLETGEPLSKEPIVKIVTEDD